MITNSQNSTENMSVRLPKKLKKRLDKVAYQKARSRNWVLNDALSQYLEVYDWQTELIEKRLAEAKSPDAVFIPHEEVMQRQLKRLKKQLGV